MPLGRAFDGSAPTKTRTRSYPPLRPRLPVRQRSVSTHSRGTWPTSLDEPQSQLLRQAMMESFWSSLKNELVHRSHFATRAQARTAIFDYIEGFFSALGYKSPSTTNPLSVNPQPSLPPAVRIIGASSKIWIETLLRTCPKFI